MEKLVILLDAETYALVLNACHQKVLKSQRTALEKLAEEARRINFPYTAIVRAISCINQALKDLETQAAILEGIE